MTAYSPDLSNYSHAVYRLYDETGRLLYVGMSCDPDSRMNDHRWRADRADWAGEYDHHEVTWYDNQAVARAAEAAAIKAEHPVHNKQHNQSPTQRPKPTRITVDLSQDEYDALNRYIGQLAATLGRRVTLAATLRAMIRAGTTDELRAMLAGQDAA